MPKVTCPKCKGAIEVKNEDLVFPHDIRCIQCGTVMKIGGSEKPPEPVAFPTTPQDETVLDLSDAVKALKKKRKKKGED